MPKPAKESQQQAFSFEFTVPQPESAGDDETAPATAGSPSASDLAFLTSDDHRRLALMDRIAGEQLSAGAGEFEVRMRIAERPDAYDEAIRQRVTPAQFDLICKRYSGVGDYRAIVRRHIRSVMGW